MGTPDEPRDEGFAAAMVSVANGMSMRKAAKMYGVAFESLRRRVHGAVDVVCRPGPQLVYLSEDANKDLLETIHARASRGVSVGTAELTRLIREAAERTSTRPLTESFPNRTFVSRWMKAHQDTLAAVRKKLGEIEEPDQYKLSAETSMPLEAHERDAMSLHNHPAHFTAKPTELSKAAGKAQRDTEKATKPPNTRKRKRESVRQP